MADWKLRSDTQDPARIYERKEGRTCKGCIHMTHTWGLMYCLKFKKPVKRNCSRYKEVE